MFENLAFIDCHYHAAPDLYHRRYDAVEAGRHYQQLNGAVVLKSHLGSTTVQANLAQRMGLPVLPSICLNHTAGGIDYRVIINALANYQSDLSFRLMVDFPTITGRSYRSKLSRAFVYSKLSSELMRGETVFNDKLKLDSAVIDVLKLAADYPIILTTGHASRAEIEVLIEACEQYDVPHLLLNQPANPLTGLSAQDLLTWSQNQRVWFEQTYLTYAIQHQSFDDLKTVLQTLPRLIYSSDLGQTSQIDIEQWYNESLTLFEKIDLSPDRVKEIWFENPISLLTY
tara:strand:- start:668 stop:1522 length:855 start_codon:yes stop_codon:yes gene_type:complete